MRVVRLLKVLGPLTCALLLAMCAGPVRGETETDTETPAPTSPETAKFNETRAKAEAGDAEAQLALGCMYDNGAGAPRSSKEAFKWWLQAAQQDLAVAQYDVAVTYDTGIGIEGEADHAQAVEWYRKAAEQGYVPAQGALGWLYYSGHGVGQDKEAAVQLWRKGEVQSAIARSAAESVGRWEAVQHVVRDSARTSLGLYVSSNMRKLTNRFGAYVTGAVFDVLPDRILYIGEDGVPCRQLKLADASDELQKEFGYSRERAEEYHRRQWEQTGVFVPETREASDNVRFVSKILSEYQKSHTYSAKDDFECVDMANDVWDQVRTKGIPAKVRVGNNKKDIKSVVEANHAWVMAELAPGRWVALEPQQGEIIYPAANPRYYRGHDFPGPNEVKEYKTLKEGVLPAAVAKRAKAAEEYQQADDQLHRWDQGAGPFSSPADRLARESLATEVSRRKAVLDERESDVAEVARKLDALLLQK